MAFCTNCGGALGSGARFCTNCGTAASGVASGVTADPSPAPAAVSTAVVAAPEPLDYKIQGDNLQVARVRLKAGQELYAEAGKMVYKTTDVTWETRMSGNTLGEKLMGAFRRTVSGESLFFTYFRAHGDGEVGFAGSYPGRIQMLELEQGRSILAQRDAFLFAQPSV